MLAGSLRGKKIKLFCTLYSRQGELLGEYGSILPVGKTLSVKIAKQLLAGGSARLIENRISKPSPDPREWPFPVLWDRLEGKGKANGRTVSVHVPVFLDGDGSCKVWLKLHALPGTFIKLWDRWFGTFSERSLGKLMIAVVLAGGGQTSSFWKFASLSGIHVKELNLGRFQQNRAVPVTIQIDQDRERHDIKFLAERDVFQRLASFYYGDEASDIRFGWLLREALWKGRSHIAQAQPINGKKRGKSLQRVAWKTAAWLGPALLDKMQLDRQSCSNVLKIVRECLAKTYKEQQIQFREKSWASRIAAAFLVKRNWMNYIKRLQGKATSQEERERFSEWIDVIPSPEPIYLLHGKSVSVSSVDFWDEIFTKQLKFSHRLIKNSGPTFILPKSLEETVDDILSGREVFILYP